MIASPGQTPGLPVAPLDEVLPLEALLALEVDPPLPDELVLVAPPAALLLELPLDEEAGPLTLTLEELDESAPPAPETSW